ncbi:bifunctional [glutamine synthetase] adenylyltransferase/[glutamine synthetase]-adenylyl-L-tyrosine phosphorylase [Hyphobacterium marinum]|uniref:Bifunctional glutamine synthetase adenylyltransferase/adenylyl-removing enzyme n=1 Tax=Hyphobacterium marinum TaxID=3116574 RepID=A0ABU7M0I2_9PROT|nr:bifunctional [glutamine synthetase] adenylyltransferase/[glutamine synthetase]-adenylyl-L-tyrosine phosphorylase [Hyphobacterium sp. Y6023]MEE2567306.1 bifunctional [glutamine synthetase] adenylyltransferase/[glutamine synthetase]-adenylyl-L-tyrosine phosphorylase [Hyphobacterium sp. Y6023]
MPDPATLFDHPLPVLPDIDPDCGERALQALDAETLARLDDASRAFLRSVFGAAPYLARLAQRCPDVVTELASTSPEKLADRLLDDVLRAGRDAADGGELDDRLRDAKAKFHLLCALCEVTGLWTTSAMTRALSGFADAAVQSALLGAARFMAERGRLAEPADPENPVPGLFLLALGKLGAEELNFSSDIDLVAFYDPEILARQTEKDPRQVAVKLVQAVTRTLQEANAGGYVFRVDLRLRPDPSSTPVAVSVESAMRYYEAMGQNWERAAYIKARRCAGDSRASAAFLRDLGPFIWRRTLDFAAVDDIRSLARQIQRVGDRARIRAAGHDLKLGRGGIREIEFIAQIPQLVFGGRDRDLRARSPVEALPALCASGKLEGVDPQSLSNDYAFLRGIEHRIQMLEDEPTQTLPADDGQRARVAALWGESSLDTFDDRIRSVLTRVHTIFSDQFDESDTLASSAGSLVFTGVDPTPDTLATLKRLGFSDPQAVWSRFNGWAGGKARAVRTARARELLTKLAPRLIDALAETGEPDAALVRFAAFFENLPMGVQPLSLLKNEPGLATSLVGIIGLAPAMARTLAQRPAILDAMLDPEFVRPLGEGAERSMDALMKARLPASMSFEGRMNEVRRISREERFRIGSQILTGRAGPRAAGKAFADLADACIRAMARAAQDVMAARFGDVPGSFAVIGMGKLGGRELAADSDLDLMLVYDGAADSDAAVPDNYFARLTQRLISALSVPTEEGGLYEVDMQLRPSGKSGPVAVHVSRFADYYAQSAWTWEHMALTRARIVCGDEALNGTIEAAIDAALSIRRDPEQIRADAGAMRNRMRAARPAAGDWDLKHRAGGLVDIEFIAQTLQLIALNDGVMTRQASTFDALLALADAGLLDDEEAARMCDIGRLYLALMQLIRTAHGSGFDPASAARGFAQRMAAIAGVDDLVALQALIGEHASFVTDCFARHVQISGLAATD